MGRRRGEEKRTYKAPASCKHGKPTLFARENEAADHHKPEADGAKIGELPLFYATSPKLTRSRPVGRTRRIATSPLQQAVKGKSGGQVSRREVGADVHLGEGVDAVWPHSQDVATWASSFHFDLDAGRLQAMLERDGRSLTSTPGGSFRFRNGTEEEEPSGNLQHGSHRFTATTASVEASDCWDVVPFEALRNVAVDVPNSPERDEILRRLNELKAAHPCASLSLLRFGLDDVTSPSLLRFGSPNLDDVVTYHKEMARRDHLHQRLKSDSCKSTSYTSPLNMSSSSTPVVPEQSQEIATALGELEIMPVTVERRRLQSANSSPSRLRGSPRRTAAQELCPITPATSRFMQSPRRSSSIQEHIVSIRKLQFPDRAPSSASSVPSPDHTPFLSAARGRIPFKWEEEPGKPKTIANAQSMSQHILRVDSSPDENIVTVAAEVSGNGGTSSARTSTDGAGVGRIESHRYYGRAHLRAHSESSVGQSSRRHGTHLEAQIDLDASAAAKFLVELYDTPLSTPGRHGSSPLFAVPFKWEDAPGKPKVETSVGRPNMLQLPPRLAVPSYRIAESFSRELRASHPLTGFFAPCLTASSPAHKHPHHHPHQRKQSDRILEQCGSSKSLPPRAPSSPSQQPERRKRHGLVGRCYSTPREGCQIRMAKSAANSPVLQAVSRDLFGEEMENSTCSEPDAAPSSPKSILCGPDEGSSSQTSASNAFSSGDLEDFTQQTNQSAQSASKSSHSSFESIEADFAELPSPAAPPTEAVQDSLLQSETEKQKRQKDIPHMSPKPATWSPALVNYFQSLEATSTSAEASSCQGELPLAPKNAFPTIQSMLQQQEFKASARASPRRPARLPYTMPEQRVASRENSTRRQLVQDLSPRLLPQYSGRRLNRSGRTTPAPRVERYHADEVCQPSPVYTAALQLLSPPVHLIAQRQRNGLATAKLPLAARPRRRARFMVSICKTLKRLVLGRQRRCKTSEPFEPKLMYDYAIAPTTFQFYQPN